MTFREKMPVFRLSERISFPSPQYAGSAGLLAIGGDLSPARLLKAYEAGIFPWYSENDPIMWWSPDPRLVLFPERFHVSGRLRRTIRQEVFDITSDTAFEQVITSCAKVRVDDGQETWIVDEMIEAFCRLFEAGYAHSVEAWRQGELAGGLYGLSLGGCFFGESMFTRISNASKVALAALCQYLSQNGFDLIDCQIVNPHLIRLGATEIPRFRFLKLLEASLKKPTHRGKWSINSMHRLGKEAAGIEGGRMSFGLGRS